MSLSKQLELVNDETTFLAFAKALLQDRLDETANEKTKPSDLSGRGSNGWENHTIETFLERAIDWAESTNIGVKQGVDPELVWKRMALFLYLGKIYE